MNARIIFDLDGTLIDSAPDIQNIANKSLTKIGVAPITLEETHLFIGNGIQNFIEQMMANQYLFLIQVNLVLEGIEYQ